METVAQKKSLVAKLAEVMGEVNRVPKLGHNNFHGYDFATEADIAAAVRGALAARGLVIVPNVEKVEWGSIATKSGEQKLCTLTVKFTVLDGDSESSISFVVLGQGADNGDKATYKAMTGAEKYALLKLFLIPTGMDPESDSPEAQALPPRPPTPPKSQPRPAPSKPQAAKPAPADERPEPPPPDEVAYQEMHDQAERPPPVTFRFGKRKGATSHEVSDEHLVFYVKCAKDAVNDTSKARFLDANQRELELLEGEVHWRAKRNA